MKDPRPAFHLAPYGDTRKALCNVTHVSRDAEIALHEETCTTCLDKRLALRGSKNMASVLAPLVGVRTLP